VPKSRAGPQGSWRIDYDCRTFDLCRNPRRQSLPLPPYPISSAVIDARQFSTRCVEIPTFFQKIAVQQAKVFCLQAVAKVSSRTSFGMPRALGIAKESSSLGLKQNQTIFKEELA
jgi:hypothetical protein